MRKVAKETGVATQMGNQGTATGAFREQVEIIQSGDLGEIRDVYVWNTNAGVTNHIGDQICIRRKGQKQAECCDTG